ncbi:hypothetical protein TRFO_40425 [Tritrichomonas foetus]|uniref:Uncharacterized protein n=1 Tax=Tritrichomonas foetus TaxID=1144522 RepID=A0A1J4J750_9EUKA|nr:hypothetical protein TRFO_40425 [Tritrichomonas foetus]|eukprot:OHS93269.1 hypothetical protein TRFO_40425 [Tritrichomonas foetus]
MSEARANFYRPEYLPHDHSNLDSVYDYLKSRVNFALRSAIEYPAVLPLHPNASLFNEIIYLSKATAYYTKDDWEELLIRINKLIDQRTLDNRKVHFKIAQQTQELLKLEESQSEMSEEKIEALNAAHQIDLINTRKRNLTKEIQWLEKMRGQLSEDPRVEVIRQKRAKLQKFDDAITDLQNSNAGSLKQLQWSIMKKENEIILLEGEIEAVQSRIDMIGSTLPEEDLFEKTSYTTEELALLDYSSTAE